MCVYELPASLVQSQQSVEHRTNIHQAECKVAQPDFACGLEKQIGQLDQARLEQENVRPSQMPLGSSEPNRATSNGHEALILTQKEGCVVRTENFKRPRSLPESRSAEPYYKMALPVQLQNCEVI